MRALTRIASPTIRTAARRCDVGEPSRFAHGFGARKAGHFAYILAIISDSSGTPVQYKVSKKNDQVVTSGATQNCLGC